MEIFIINCIHLIAGDDLRVLCDVAHLQLRHLQREPARLRQLLLSEPVLRRGVRLHAGCGQVSNFVHVFVSLAVERL